MSFRIASLNIEQDHKRWHERRELIVEQWGKLHPDLLSEPGPISQYRDRVSVAALRLIGTCQLIKRRQHGQGQREDFLAHVCRFRLP